MKPKSTQNAGSPWDNATLFPSGNFRFQEKDAPPVTEEDICSLRVFAETKVSEPERVEWLLRAYNVLQETMCKQCDKGQLTLAELCRNIILAENIAVHDIEFKADVFLAWLKKAAWRWHPHFDQLSKAVKSVYRLPKEILEQQCYHVIVVALMTKIARLAKKQAANPALGRTGELLGYFLDGNPKIVAILQSDGIPEETVKMWLQALVTAESVTQTSKTSIPALP